MIDFYDSIANEFLQDTRDVDMTAVRNRFLAALPQASSDRARILDAGTGSGRDARLFGHSGYQVEAFDASPAMVQAATTYAEVPVRLMRFEDFAWDHAFEGIWACASLLHVALIDLPGVMRCLAARLVPEVILYASFKIGVGERHKGGRHFTDMTEETFSTLLDECPSLRQVEIWRSKDHRPDRKEDIWLNILLRRL